MIGFQADKGCVMKLNCKSLDDQVSESLLESIDWEWNKSIDACMSEWMNEWALKQYKFNKLLKL